jgi:hypothetical protein
LVHTLVIEVRKKTVVGVEKGVEEGMMFGRGFLMHERHDIFGTRTVEIE